MGSTEAVSKIKWLFQADKAGHAGTLDPLASGMLPIALGEATKTVPYVQDGAKIYRFTVAWGEERSTDDLEGPVTKTSDKPACEADIRALMPKYTGVIMQTPPQFSAIKIGGERAYDLAREGEVVEIPAREVEIGRFDLLETTPEGKTVFEIECGKGTYVRSYRARHRPRSRLLRPHRGHCAGPRSIRLRRGPCAARRARGRGAEARGSGAGRGTEARSCRASERFAAIDAFIVDTGAALDCLPQVGDHRRCGGQAPARQSRSSCAAATRRRGRRGLRDGARQAGGDRRNRGRHVQAEAGFRQLHLIVMSAMDDGKVRRYEQISLYCGDDFVITFQERKGDPFGPVRKRIEAADLASYPQSQGGL